MEKSIKERRRRIWQLKKIAMKAVDHARSNHAKTILEQAVSQLSGSASQLAVDDHADNADLVKMKQTMDEAVTILDETLNSLKKH